MPTSNQLKDANDSAIRNKTTAASISPTDVADALASGLDFTSQEVATAVAAVTNEVTARQSADTALQTSISATTSAISKEVNDRQAADSGLQTAINANATAIANEVSARLSVDTTLQASITSLQATTASNASAITANSAAITANTSAITTLQAGNSTPSSQQPALGRLLAGLALRTLMPVRIVFAGSSTTAGNNASTEANRYVNRVAAFLQSAYPSGTGSEAAIIASTTSSYGSPSSAVGIQVYNSGEGGTTAATYLTGTRPASVAALAPFAVFHMIGSNDFANGVNPATYKSQVQASIDAINSALTLPCVHILIQPYERYDSTTHSYSWASYGQAMASIAAANPNGVAYFDISGNYYALGIPSTDPLGLMSADKVHQNDKGHALMAELIRQALRIGFITTTTTTTAAATPGAPTNVTATPGTNQITINATAPAGTGGSAITGYTIYKVGTATAIASNVALPYVDATASTSVATQYQVSAVNSAGEGPKSTASAAITATASTPAPTGTLTTYLINMSLPATDNTALGTGWNNVLVGNPTAAANFGTSNLVSSTGTSSTKAIQFTNVNQGTSGGTANVASGNSGWAGGDAMGIVGQAWKEFLFMQPGITVHFDLIGLNPAKTYSVELWGSRATNADRQTSYTIGGVVKSHRNSSDDGLGNHTASSLFTSLAPNASGVIGVDISVYSGSFGYLNFLRLIEN